MFYGFQMRNKCGQGGGISSPSNVPSSVEDSVAGYENIEDEGLDAATRKSCWFELCSSRRGLVMNMKMVYSSISSSNSLPSTRD